MKAKFLRTIVLFIALGLNFPILSAQQGDTLFIQRGKKGDIEFASFKVKANSDRKMKNDTVFLKSMLKRKTDSA